VLVVYIGVRVIKKLALAKVVKKLELLFTKYYTL